MATAAATRQVEQIVRRVMSEEMDETVNAIQEISTLLTEQVIPRLSGEADDDAEFDDSEPTNGHAPGGSRSFSASGARAKPGRVNGHDDSEEIEAPDQDRQEVPEAVTSAFAEFYRTLTPEQAQTLAGLFTAIDGELENRDEASDEGSEAAGRG